ncbi:MAG: hypothetical protein Q8O22_00130, partial [Candidatus Omnitrophota bacterium]|nr:hypothetical protein [Candidatus Omnitrophota bacterium]
MANNMLKKNNIMKRFPIGWVIGLIVFFAIINLLNTNPAAVSKELAYGNFYRLVKDAPDKLKSVTLTKVENVVRGEYADGSKFSVNIPENDPELLALMNRNLRDFNVVSLRTF